MIDKLKKFRELLCEREPYDDCNEYDKAYAEGCNCTYDYLLEKFDTLFGNGGGN